MGGTGMLGHKLWQTLSPRFDTHVAVRSAYRTYESLALFEPQRWHAGVDATHFDTIRSVIQCVMPTVTITCIGVIKQRADATDPVVALQTNSLFPHLLYRMAQSVGAHLIHISTDCVFSGRQGHYVESDLPDPPDLYGRSKLLGEIEAEGCLTLRTSIIGRELGSAYGLVEWFLAQAGGRVRGFTRAIYTGMPTVTLASLIAELLSREAPLSGLYHVAAPPISKYDLLCLIREAFGVSVGIDRDESFVCDRSLIAERFQTATCLSTPSWPAMIETMAGDAPLYHKWRELC